MFKEPSFVEISSALESENTPIAQRMSMLFWAKQLGGNAAVEVLRKGLGHSSVLFKHELAYVLGQIGEMSAVEVLVQLLEDNAEHDMVRHEAAEALAALNAVAYRPVLEKYITAQSAPIRETCQIALASIDMKERKDSYQVMEKSAFNSMDPISTCSSSPLTLCDIARYSKQLNNNENPLPSRYEALFALRNGTRPYPTDGTEKQSCSDGSDDSHRDGGHRAVSCAAVEALCNCLYTDKSSALLRHEIAFVLGQVLSAESTVTLSRVLMNESEHSMARHEAAMALGSVLAHHSTQLDPADLESGTSLLRTYSEHGDQIVAESCVVALDTLSTAMIA
eukprot:Lankesteria_metandrocarpae@DN5546_c0_g1_i1.p1